MQKSALQQLLYQPSTLSAEVWAVGRLAGCDAMLDFGSGSGVVAFAALLFGCRRAVGVEIDPYALKARDMGRYGEIWGDRPVRTQGVRYGEI